jgi:DNA-directed RNA polymerase subunit alpha
LLWSILINSLQPGQGITIGNQLRRVLLGDLGGIAISAVRIAGVTHEFSTIPGVREDILEILLNLKGIVVKTKHKIGLQVVNHLYCNNFYLKHS